MSLVTDSSLVNNGSLIALHYFGISVKALTVLWPIHHKQAWLLVCKINESSFKISSLFQQEQQFSFKRVKMITDCTNSNKRVLFPWDIISGKPEFNYYLQWVTIHNEIHGTFCSCPTTAQTWRLFWCISNMYIFIINNKEPLSNISNQQIIISLIWNCSWN